MQNYRPHTIKINQLLIVFFLLLSLFINACKKNKTESVPTSEKNLPKAFIVSVKDREADRAVLTWTAQPNEVLTYDIELEGKVLVQDLPRFQFDIRDLVASRTYTGKVIAHDRDGNKTTSEFDIKIFDQEIYMTNIIDYNWAKTAFDGSGELYWKINRGSLLSIPVISGDTIFIGGSSTAIAVNRLTGTLIWSRPSSTPDNLALLCYKGKLVLPGENKLDIINSATGSTIWTLNLPEYTEPFINKGTLYTSADQNVYAYDLNTGVKKWEFRAGGKAAAPLVSDGTVYFIGAEGNFYALRAIDGILKWKNSFTGTVQVSGHHSSRPSIMGNNVYFVFAKDIYYSNETEYTVRAVNKITAETVWNRAMGKYLRSVSMMPSTRLGLCVSADRLYLLDPLTGIDKPNSGVLSSDYRFNVVENQIYYSYYQSKTVLCLATYRQNEIGNIFVMPNGDGWWRIPIVVKEGKVYYPAESAMNMIE